jgi:hypothetical protein
MKKISLDKIKEFVQTRKKLLISSFVALLLIITIGFAYLALNPIDDPEAASTGEKALQELNVRFDTNTINELGEEKAPSLITGQGGRNPFASY